MNNLEIAAYFYDIADFLEYKKASLQKVRTYRRAAQAIEHFPGKIAELKEPRNLTSIPGVGRELVESILELLSTGRLKYYEELSKEIPVGLLELNKIDRSILRGIQAVSFNDGKAPIGIALNIAKQLVQVFRSMEEVAQAEIAGSIRRWQETVENIVLVVATVDADAVFKVFKRQPLIREILLWEAHQAVAASWLGVPIVLQLVKPPAFWHALFYHTGSKAHLERLTYIARQKGQQILPEGVFSIAEPGV